MLTFSSKRLVAVLAMLMARQAHPRRRIGCYCHGFVIPSAQRPPRLLHPHPIPFGGGGTTTHLFSTANEEVSSMRASEIKKELESYGISTKSFLEKTELVDALTKARAEGLKPKQKPSSTTSDSSSSSSSSSSTAAASSSSTSSASREERLQKELEVCRAMKVSELKKELQERGLSTSYFEKSEFVDALAEARVDGISKRPSSSTAGNDEEGYAEYADVEVLTDTSAGPRQKQSSQQRGGGGGSPFSSPFGGEGAGASPFGGAGMGDMMGGMGGIADMLKNLGVGGAAAGANPFGGGGASSPFGGGGGMGDAMGKAQEMLKNPKVREIVAKAQSNPKLMAAVNECMSNPAAFAKYQNDPEISGLLKELQKYM